MARKKKEEVTERTPMDTIECICSNVHLGDGVILRATRNQHGNWSNGDVAQVSHADAVFLEKRGQVKIL